MSGTLVSGTLVSGTLASGALVSGALVSGTLASGAPASGALASGACVFESAARASPTPSLGAVPVSSSPSASRLPASPGSMSAAGCEESEVDTSAMDGCGDALSLPQADNTSVSKTPDVRQRADSPIVVLGCAAVIMALASLCRP